MKLWDEIRGILKTPFVGELDIMHLFLLIGLVLVFSAIWVIILHHIKTAGMEIVG